LFLFLSTRKGYHPMSKQHSALGTWYILAATLLWGTTGTAQAFSPLGYDPLVIGTLRLVIGGAALFGLALFRHELGHWRDWNWFLVLAAALFTASYQVCFFAAVAKTGVAVGTMVSIGSAPIIGGLLGKIYRGELLSRRWWFATALAVSGGGLLGLGSGTLTVNLFGIALALGAGASYATYTLLIKGLLEKHSPNAVMALVVCGGAILLAPLLLNRDLAWLAQPRAIAVVLHLGLATMALSYWFFSRGLQMVQVSTAVTLSLAEPMVAATLGIAVLGEQLTVPAFGGISFIFAGLLVLIVNPSLPGRRKTARATDLP